MKIHNLTVQTTIYTCNVYFVGGTWNALADVNTLIDVGRDPAIIQALTRIATGLGKRPVEQVVLTHSHYDHAGLLPVIRELFQPIVAAFSPYASAIDRVLHDGDALRIGDQMFEVIHTPGHSSDSICLYSAPDGVLFAGDTPLLIDRPGGTYEEGFLQALARLSQKDVRAMYFGHGPPLLENCPARLRASLANVRTNRRNFSLT